MTSLPAVLVVGEALIDVVVHPDGSRDEHPGGSPANVALTLGRLGHPPTLLTCLGDDPAGRLVRDWLTDSQVRVDPRSFWPGAPTSQAIARLDHAGAAHYELDVSWQLPEVETEDVDLLHIGSIAATLSPGARVVRRIVEKSSAHTLVSYDPNIRPAFVADADATRAAVEVMAANADLIKASDEDLRWVDPSAAPEDTARRWLRGRPTAVMITRGAEGATALTSLGELSVAAPRVGVADTVGAGDTLMGAVLAGLIDRVLDARRPGTFRQRLQRLGLAELESLLRFGVAAAAITVSREGADPPWRFELEPCADR